MLRKSGCEEVVREDAVTHTHGTGKDAIDRERKQHTNTEQDTNGRDSERKGTTTRERQGAAGSDRDRQYRQTSVVHEDVVVAPEKRRTADPVLRIAPELVHPALGRHAAVVGVMLYCQPDLLRCAQRPR